MRQGYSGSSIRRVGNSVEKRTSDRAFVEEAARQQDLISLSQKLASLADVQDVDGAVITMAFIEGVEGLAGSSAFKAGQALRELHEQPGYPHPCHTGIRWLVELANANLRRTGGGELILPSLADHYPSDALIHSEPTQYIEDNSGQIVFIDIEEIGRGSRYRDLAFIYYSTLLSGDLQTRDSFMRGYTSSPIDLEENRIIQVAGLTAAAYARFADSELRLATGLQLLEAAEQGQAPRALARDTF